MHAKGGFEWNDRTIAALRQLWAEGHSTSEVGRKLGTTKNAVVGKAHRLDLPGRDSPIRKESSAPPPPRRRPVPKLADIMPIAALAPPCTPAKPPPPPAPPPAMPQVAVSEPVTGNKACSWPIGDPGAAGFRFCTAPALIGKPYCAEHARLAYLKPPSRRPDAAPPERQTVFR